MMMDNDTRTLDVLAFGESLIDFLPEQPGLPLRRVDTFRKVVGGAPTNLALGLARLGCPAGLHGKVGDDEFGAYILETLEAAGADVRGVARADAAPTGLTFVSIDDEGDRSFAFYRNESADMVLAAEDVDDELIASARLFQVGSNLLIREGVREATHRALEAAREAETLISIDPNIRLHLWPSRERARQACLALADDATVYKINDEELAITAPDRTPEEAWREVFAPRGVDLFVVTLGAEGAVGFTRDGRHAVDAPEVDVVDTTGAGDGFMAGLLAGLAAEFAGDDWTRRFRNLEVETLAPILELGCHVGARVCTALGATPPLPDREVLPERLSERLHRHAGLG